MNNYPSSAGTTMDTRTLQETKKKKTEEEAGVSSCVLRSMKEFEGRSVCGDDAPSGCNSEDRTLFPACAPFPLCLL